MDELTESELRKQVLVFLKEMRELIGDRKYIVKNHYKNTQALIDYGINEKQRDEIIYSLSLTDYSKGPCKDTQKPGIYWIFGTFIEDKEVYIKMKIHTNAFGNDKGICFSFHPPTSKMEYPFRIKK